MIGVNEGHLTGMRMLASIPHVELELERASVVEPKRRSRLSLWKTRKLSKLISRLGKHSLSVAWFIGCESKTVLKTVTRQTSSRTV